GTFLSLGERGASVATIAGSMMSQDVMCTSTDQLGSALTYITKTFQSIGSTRLKAQYRRYTDASFSQLSPQPSSHGLPGPLVAAENRLPFNVTFTPDGGLVTLGDTVYGAVVEPGQNLTYSWVVPQQAGPSKADLPSVAYTYSSTLSPSHEVAGL
ncbi:uncharacterized protein HaLaN_24237, partial [Haematococcus lacustris]